MFDIGFSEIVVIAVVALIVIGPEKLPKTARTLGHLFGRLQRYVNEVKSDINREMELEELRKLQQEVKTAAQDFQTSVTSTAQEVESSVRSVESQLNEAAAEAGSTTAPPAEPAPEMLPLAAPPLDEPRKPDPPAQAEPPRQSTLPGLDRG
jgi:sec-independent protein translocase protein TatB